MQLDLHMEKAVGKNYQTKNGSYTTEIKIKINLIDESASTKK